MLAKRIRIVSGVVIVGIVTAGFAAAYQNNIFSRSSHKWDFFAGIGYTNYLSGTQNQSIQSRPTENDPLQQQSHGNSVGYFVGMQRTYLLHNSIIPEIAVGPTLSYNPVHFDGQVYQYQLSPEFNNYSYVYKARPVDAAIETQILLPKIIIFNKVALAPYALIGAGMSVVSLHYAETPLPGIRGGALNGSSTVVRPLGIFGAGFQWNVARHCFVRTEYRFHYRDDAGFVPSGASGKALVNLNEQSANILFGYNFK